MPTCGTCTATPAPANASRSASANARDRGFELVVASASSCAERGEPGRGRERVPRERAGLVHGAERRELVHHVGAAADRGEREPAADDLAEDREVGRDVEAALRAAGPDAEAR